MHNTAMEIPPKVFYDFQIFSLQPMGGVSRYFVSIWKELAALGAANIEVFLGFNQTRLVEEISAVADIRGLVVDDPLIPRTRRLVWAINRAMCVRQLASSGAAIYHPTYFWTPERGVRPKRLVLTVYDLVHEIYPHLFGKGDYIYKWRAKALDRADAVIAISEKTKEDISRFYKFPADRIFVTHLGCSFTNALERQDQAACTSERPVLLYVGQRRGYKNFKVLQDLWSNSNWVRRNFRLVVFGGGEPSAEELLLQGDVKFCGGNDADLAVWYRCAFLFIYPSLYEGFGLPILECFHFGCPVLTSGCGSIREVGGDCVDYFDANSWESLENRMQVIFNSDQYRSELIAKGRQRVGMFSWKRCAEETLAVYRRVL